MDELAQKLASMRDGVAPPWNDARRQQVLASVITLQGRQRRRKIIAMAGSAALALCSVVYLSVRGPSGTELRARLPVAPEPSASTAPAGATRSAVAHSSFALAAPGTRLLAGELALLADGSSVQVAADGGEVWVEGNQRDAIDLQLTAGSAHFEVVPNTQRRFRIVAGSVSVFVLGTAFDVERAQHRVRVAVNHGRVRVVSAAGEAFVQAEESRWFEQVAERDAGAIPAVGDAHGARVPGTKPRVTRVAAVTVRGESPARVDWRSLNSSGDYERAYHLLAEGAPVENEAEALMDAADAARLSDHPEVAANYLAKVLREHRRSPSTPLAAFTLGRLLLERLARPAEAAEAFATAQALAPHGSLAQDALAREVEAWSKAGRTEEAYRRADLFVQTYPNSRRLSAVKQYGGVREP